MKKSFTAIMFAICITGIMISPSSADPGNIGGFDVGYIQNECRHVQEVLPDPVPGRYWIVMENLGLALLDVPTPGNPRFTIFHIPGVRYGAGPDSKGNIYLTSYGKNFDCGIRVFNSATLSMGEYHPLDGIENVFDLDLSGDGSHLYVVASVWPVNDEGYSPGESYPDSGLLLEVDPETFEITRRASIGQEPTTLFVGTNDLVYIDTSQEVVISTVNTEEFDYCDHSPSGSLTDSVNTNTFERSNRFACSAGPGNFIKWSDDGSKFAWCNAGLSLIPTKPEYDCGLWIFDSGVNAVVRTIKITDDSENPYGVYTGIASGFYNGIAYLSMVDAQTYESYDAESTAPYNMMAIDMESGKFIAGTKLDFMPNYLCELDDGSIVAFGPFDIHAVIKPVD
ncbi:MAG: hypothetical protein ABIC40_04080 [bacterium]